MPDGLPAIGWREQLAYWAYRASAYLMLNGLDDPALVALVFC